MGEVAEPKVAEAVHRYLAAWNEQNPGRPASVVDAHNDRVRFRREAGGTEDAPTHFAGSDFGIVGKDGRFESITGFVDVGPGALSKS